MERVGVTYLENVRARQKPKTAGEYERLWQKHIVPALGRRPVAEVDVSEIRRLHNALAATPYLANRLLAVLSAFFTFARREGWRPDNPARDESLDRYPEASRERFLSPAEVTKLGEALTRAETVGLPPAPELRKPAPTKRPQNRPKSADVPNPANPHAVAALRLLLLTGCREGEIRTLRWDAVDLERGFLRLADTKTGRSVRPLGAAAAELLSGVRKVHRSPYVFPGLRPSVPLRSLKRLWHAVRFAAGLPDVRLHDLRHSFASFSAIGGDSLLVTRALLGHRTVSSTSRYAHLSDDPVRAAVDRVAGDLASLLRGQKTDVTPIRKGRA